MNKLLDCIIQTHEIAFELCNNCEKDHDFLKSYHRYSLTREYLLMFDADDKILYLNQQVYERLNRVTSLIKYSQKQQ